MGGEPNNHTSIVGIEGGATKTVAILSNGTRRTFGPLNLRLASDRQILAVLRQFQPPHAALCLAGCRTAADRQRLRALARRAWPDAKTIFIGSDLESAFAAAFGPEGTGIVVLSGTGSCVYGRNGSRTARAGGRGHLLGDTGSGYWIALATLRSQLRRFDHTGRVPAPLARVLRRLCLNRPDDLIDWALAATKSDIAALLPELFDADPRIVSAAAEALAADCVAVARRLRLSAPAVALAGGVFVHQPKFARLTARKIRQLLPRARIRRVPCEPAAGALRLAGADAFPTVDSAVAKSQTGRDLGAALTEQRNPRTMDLQNRSVPQLIDTMLAEEARVIPALRKNKRAIERAIRAIVAAFKRGGRLFYVGAGTSGRLAVLDASECPPTFSTPPEMVQGIIAGGLHALHCAVEAAEDDPQAGAEAVAARRVGRRDVVVGISASGSTPFVLGALDEAKRRGARTFLVCFSKPARVRHCVLFFRTGPEVVAGSTRLKAGTATKLVLNMLSTISMIRLGKVVGNLMVDVQPNSEKLRDRACRIVAALRRCGICEARQRLVRAHWNVRAALR
jgi:N-acetylmuramic acid 6-phosphate etherase